MNSFKTAVAILSPVKFISRFNTWRTARREEQMKEWEGMERVRKGSEPRAREWESKAMEQFKQKNWRVASDHYVSAELFWKDCYDNINQLTPDARKTRTMCANAIFRCRGRLEECEDKLRRQTSRHQQQETSA